MKNKRVTMKDIAEATGVSRTTVSFILNNAPTANIPEVTRQRVIQAAKDMNYVPNIQATNLARGKTMLVGLVVRQSEKNLVADYFMAEVSRGITQIIEPEGYHLVLNSAEEDAAVGSLVRTGKVDGLIVSSLLAEDDEIERLHLEGIPLVQHGSTRWHEIPSVDVDNVAGARLAVDHLLELGHRRIGFITNAPFSYAASQDRRKGYRGSLHDANLPYDETLVVQGNFTEESGQSAMHYLLALPEPPTAVFVGSDVVAVGAIAAAHQQGLSIPDDISIIGFDNLHFGSFLQPPLTTISLPAQQLGQHLGQMMLSILQGEPLVTPEIRLQTELVVRGSTRPIVFT